MKNLVKLTYFIIILLSMTSNSLNAQTYINEEWEENTGIPNSNLINARVTTRLDNANDLIVVGHTVNTNNNTDILITKYNEDGSLHWQKQYNGLGNGNDYGTGVWTDVNNNVYVIGVTQGINSNLDIALLKYDIFGTLVWTAIWNGASNLDDIPLAITTDLNGNIIIVGGSEDSNNQMDYLTLKYKSNGTLEWSSIYDYANGYDMAAAVEINSANQIIVSGASASSSSNWDFATILLENNNGSIASSHRNTTTGIGLDKVNGITIDDNNNLYVTGYTEVNNQKDIQTIKLDANFNLVWVETFDGANMNDVAEAIGLDALGNVYITGYSEQSNGISELLTIKYNPNGTTEWIERYENANNGEVYATNLSITSQGEVLIGGSIEEGNDKELLTLVYDLEGRLRWTKINENNNSDEEGLETTSDNLGNIYVTGISDDGTSEKYTTLKYSTFDRTRQPLFNSNGEPDRLDNELVVRFQPDAIIKSNFDNKEIIHGTLGNFLTVDALNDIKDAVGFKVSDFECFKVHPRMTTADTLSLTRTGRWIKISPFYATLVVIVPNTVDEYLFEYDLEQVYQHVQIVDFNHLYTLHNGADDTFYQNDSSAGLIATSAIPDANINIEPAWALSVGHSSVKVGVFDSGINYKHQDFGDGTWSGSVIKNGHDYLNNQNLPITGTALADSTGHGTAVAGIIGAIRNNNFGIAGIAGGDDLQGVQGVSLHDMKISSYNPNAYECNDKTSFSDNATLQSAIIEGASNTSSGFGFSQDIQNHSWGGAVADTTIENAIQNAFLHGVILTISSGNGGNAFICNTSSAFHVLYPASYKDEWILKVGANDSTGNRANFSNCGYGLDIIAPGTNDLYQSLDNNTNSNFEDNLNISISNQTCVEAINGTSYAAPHVAGLSALMISYINSNSTPNTLVHEDCEAIIKEYATNPIPSVQLPTDEIGYGRINAGEVMNHIYIPKYKIQHFDLQTVNYIITPQNIGYARVNWNGVGGGRRCRKYKITVTDNLVTTGNYTPINAWVRTMQTNLIEIPLETDSSNLGSDTDIPSNNNQIFVDNLTPSTITLSGYVYEILDTNTIQGGYNTLAWYPFDTSSLVEFAYTLHLEDSIITSTSNLEIDFRFEIFPQPASNYTNIQINSDYKGELSLRLFDITGRELKNIYQSRLMNNKQNFHLDTSWFPNGIYIVTVGSENFIQSKKLIIQK
jgi:subtilisin family serine protease